MKSFKYRIYPTVKQQIKIAQYIGVCRMMYNLSLEVHEHAYASGVKFSETQKSLYSQYRELKQEPGFDFIGEVPSTCIVNVFRNLENAYKKFFKGTAKYPTYKKRQHAGSIQAQKCKIDDNSISFPKLGRIKAVIHRPFDGELSQYNVCTISRTANSEFYFSFSPKNQKEPRPRVKAKKVVGVDIGVRKLAVASDGFTSPKIEKRYEDKIQKLQRKQAKQQRGSNRYEVTRKRIATLKQKQARHREHRLHNLSRQLVTNYDAIGVEGFKIPELVKNNVNLKGANGDTITRKQAKNYNKALLNNALGSLRLMLEYKFKEEGKHLFIMDELFPASQLCSKCGHQHEEAKNPSLIKWTCPSCGTEHNRSENSARNVYDQTKRLLAAS